MKTTILTFLFILGLAAASAQTWNTAGSGLPGTWTNNRTGLCSFNFNNELYAAYSEYDAITEISETYVKRWNGLVWQSLPSIPDFHVEDILVDVNGVYVFGWNKIANVAFYEFDAGTWVAQAPTGFGGKCMNAEFITGDMVVVGDFSAPSGMENIYRYDGTSFNNYPTMSSSIQQIDDLKIFNSELYIACETNGVGSLDGFLKLDAGVWTSPAHFRQGTTTIQDTFSLLVEYQNELYIVEKGGHESDLFRLGIDTLHFVGHLPHSATDAIVYNAELYIIGDTSNGSVGSSNQLSKYDNFTLSPLAGPKGNASIDTLNSELYVFSKTTSTLNGVLHNHVFRSSTSILNGYAYLDLNADCFKNSNEPFLENIYIGLNTSGLADFTNDMGFYSFSLQNGSYSFGTLGLLGISGKNLISNCTLPSPLVVGVGQTFSQNIALSNSVATDMVVLMIPSRGYRSRHGFTETYKVIVANAGNTTQASVTAKLSVPLTLTNIGSSAPSANISGNTITFSLLNMQPYEVRELFLSAKVDTAYNNVGDTLCWLAEFSPNIAGDADISDNADVVKQIVFAAYDPNDKTASASRILVNTDKIDYHINFQNTGNDTAYKVTVVDSLALNLPITSVSINSASHNYSLSVINNVLIWEFNNILLPDSGTNYYGSQGYVNFTVNISAGLAVGDTVTNDAQIYFDYQAAVFTNTAKTLVVVNPPVSLIENKQLVGALSFYPNPSRDYVMIQNEDDDPVVLSLVDSKGKIIDRIHLQAFEKVNYSTLDLPKGLYSLQHKERAYKLLKN